MSWLRALQDLALFNFKVKKYGTFQRRIAVHDLARVLQASTGSGLPELGIVMWDLLREHDYHLLPRSTAQRDAFISVLTSAYYRLLGMDLPVVSVASSAALAEQLAKKVAVQARPGDSAAEVLTRRAIVRAAIQSGYTLHARAASIAAAGGCVSLSAL